MTVATGSAIRRASTESVLPTGSVQVKVRAPKKIVSLYQTSKIAHSTVAHRNETVQTRGDAVERSRTSRGPASFSLRSTACGRVRDSSRGVCDS